MLYKELKKKEIKVDASRIKFIHDIESIDLILTELKDAKDNTFHEISAEINNVGTITLYTSQYHSEPKKQAEKFFKDYFKSIKRKDYSIDYRVLGGHTQKVILSIPTPCMPEKHKTYQSFSLDLAEMRRKI
jgi:hypothetical protein